MPPPIKLKDIIEGLEFQSDEGSSYLNTTTGEVVYVTEEELQAAEEDEPPEAFPEWQRDTIRIAGDILETDHYLTLPTKFDIHEYSIAIWGKFIIVSGASICALSRLSVDEVAQIPELRQLASMAVSETMALANAKGLSFGPEYIQKADALWDEVAESNPAWRPSLLQDLDAGRPLELDAWCGDAVMIGKELDIPTPVNFAIYAGLKPYENGRLA